MDTIGTGSRIIGHQLQLALTVQTPITVEKVAAVASSRDRAISTPAEAAWFQLQQAGDFSGLLLAHERAWMQLWDDFGVTAAAASPTGLALNLHTFRVLQATAGASIDLDVGIAARGLHGEGYRGHVFWDEAFVYPLLTLRRTQLTRDLLATGIGSWMPREPPPATPVCPGPCFRGTPSDGRVETPTQLFNLISGAWLADNSHLQRHVGLAIACMLATYSQRRSAQPTPNSSKLALADQPATNASRRRTVGSLWMVFAVAGRAGRRRVGGRAVAVADGRPDDERRQQEHRGEYRQPYDGCPPGAEPSLQP